MVLLCRLCAFLQPTCVPLGSSYASVRTSWSSTCGTRSSIHASAAASRDRGRRNKASKGQLSNVGLKTPMIQWYPGHIAKAERSLRDSIKTVDVVIEVRDARAAISTAHPRVPEWVGSRRHIIALSHADLAANAARRDWANYFRASTQAARFIDARRGRGVSELKKLAVSAGDTVNERRRARGLLPRPVRCLVVGYPNVGKSALINRLVGRKAARSANTPGITRSFQWIRLSNDLELLDMPGIIPMRIDDQVIALRLAMCDDIGHAAYDRQIVAARMVDELKHVALHLPAGYFDLDYFQQRFQVDASNMSGEEFLHSVAHKLHHGDLERTANRFFTTFRSGLLGPVALEAPPAIS